MGSLTSRPGAQSSSDDKCELERAILSEINRIGNAPRMKVVIEKIESALALAKRRAAELENAA